MVFDVYDRVTATIESALSSENSSTNNKSRYQVSVHHSRDSATKQWMGTQALVLRGLSRVLRNFFSKLLETTDNIVGDLGSNTDTPWFDDAWNKILAFAFEAATQIGGRDTLDLRTAGTELIVLCAQLSCKQGIQAAITPARVGTNMEVVNGALRSVRSPGKEGSKRESPSHSHSTVTEMWRKNLFLDAFDVLDSFREHLESDASIHHESGLHHTLEPTQVQVLAKFTDDMKKLYDCCKNDEFLEDRLFEEVEDFERLMLTPTPQFGENDPIVARFVQIVASVALNSSSGPDARYLSQAQRASVEILRTMGSDGSPQALLVLTELCGKAFFLEQDDDGKMQQGVDVLEHETTMVLQRAFSTQALSDELRVLLLCRMFSGLLESLGNEVENNFTVSYAQINSLLFLGFPAVANVQQSNVSGPRTKLLDILWDKVTLTFTRVLTPVISKAASRPTIPHTAELAKMVKAVSSVCPPRWREDICAVLTQGISSCLEIAKTDASQKQGALDLFRACFGGVCQMAPRNRALEGITENVLFLTISAISQYQHKLVDLLDDVHVQACLVICDAMRGVEGVNLLAIKVFPQLCQLVGTDLMELRKAVGDVLVKVDISQVVAECEAMRLAAEERAVVAEIKVVELTKEIKTLRSELARLKVS
jgi:hypothetical protein